MTDPQPRATTPADRPDDGSPTYLRVVSRVTRESGLTQAQLGRAVGASERAVQTWAAGTNHPRGAKAERLLDLNTIIELLADVYTPEGIKIWMQSRNRNLGMRRPTDLLDDGQIDGVLQEAERLAGGFV